MRASPHLSAAEAAYLHEKCGDGTLHAIALSVICGDLEGCVTSTRVALEDRGIAPATVVDRGLVAGMEIVGPRFRDGAMFVPEVLIAVRAMKGAMGHLAPLLVGAGVQPIAVVVLGTVKGDVHDVGKNLVAMMLESANFRVVDLGIDQKPESFVAAVVQHRPAIVALSAMLTTTMMNMATAIEAIRLAGLREQVNIMVGGAPVTAEFAHRIGADAYGRDAADAVVQAKLLLARAQSPVAVAPPSAA